MATVRITSRIRVVLEKEYLSADAFLFETAFGGLDEPFQDPLAGLVVGHDVVEAVTLRRRVLGMAANVEVEPGPILEENV